MKSERSFPQHYSTLPLAGLTDTNIESPKASALHSVGDYQVHHSLHHRRYILLRRLICPEASLHPRLETAEPSGTPHRSSCTGREVNLLLKYSWNKRR